jgi:tetratricopeptide (TPR) repeat protein
MTRSRLLPLAGFLILASVVRADDDGAKNAKKEVAFGIDVARRGLWQEARFRFELATTLSPDSASAYNNLGVTLEQQGDFEKARVAYERALQIDPKNVSIQQNYDLFREADEKRNRKSKNAPKPKESPAAAPAPSATPAVPPHSTESAGGLR